jgi:DNA-binding response OmpR family regulator
MERLHLTLLGGAAGRLSSGSPVEAPPKGLAVLAYLALAPGAASGREALASLLWGDTLGAHQGLTRTLSGLHRALARAGNAVLVSGDTVALDLDAVEVDVHAFERCLAEATPAGWASATGLYRGDLLHGFELGEAAFTEWLIGERHRLRGLAIGALESLLTHEVHHQRARPAIQMAQRLFAINSRHPGPGASPPQVPSVLVVEDEIVTREHLIAILTTAGYAVVAAADGAAALILLSRRPFDLILSDIMMPVLDGLQLLEIVRDKRIETPVVFLTGRTGSASEARARQLGAVDYITKPIDREVLLRRLASALRARTRAPG